MRSGGRGRVLFAVAIGWFLSLGVRVMYPALVPFFQDEFGISLTTAGLLLTGIWGAYALGQFPGGIVGDRYGEGRMLVVSTVLAAASMIVVSMSLSFPMLFAASVSFGLATAIFGPVRFSIFSNVFPERTGTAVGLTMAAGNIGNSVLPVVAVVLAGVASWRVGFGLSVPAFLLIGGLLFISVPSRTSGSGSIVDELSLETLRDLARGVTTEGIPLILVMQILLAIVYQGFVGFYPTFLIEVKGLSPALAAVLFGLFFGLAIVIQPAAGLFQDKLGAKPTLLSLIAGATIGLVALTIFENVWIIIGLTAVMSLRTGIGVITNTFIVVKLPADMKGTGLGLLRTAWIFIGALTPVFIGMFGDRGLLSEAYIGLAIISGLAFVLAVFLPNLDST